MAKTVIDYLRELQSLLPKGKAWTRDEGSTSAEFLHGDAEEFAHVDERSDDLLQERDTRYTSELLIDHENDLGLPDECSPEGETIQERRLAVHSKLIALGQQNPAYFIELATAFGWTITITEYSPFWCGVMGSGEPCGDQETIFYWKITITIGSGNIVYFLSGSSESGDPLSYLPGTESMICTFNKLKPGHTVLIYDFDGPEYGIGFGPGFDSLPSETESHLEGCFSQGFGLGFNVNLGGGFNADGFGIGFKQPA